MKKIVPAVVAAAALVAFPVAGVQAKPAGKRGQDTERHAGKRDAESKRNAKSKRCKKQSRRGFVVRGSLAGYDAESVTLDVERANKHARRWLRDNDPTFDTSAARFAFEGVDDASGDGHVDLDDAVATDRVRVLGKLSMPKRGCDGDGSLHVHKVVVTRETEDGDEA